MTRNSHTLLLAFQLLLLSSNAWAMPEPAAIWLFDEGTGAVAHDFTGHGNDGTVVGALWNTDAPFPSGCNFSLEFHNAIGAYATADAYVVIPDRAALRPGSALTIEARIKAFDPRGRHIFAKQLGDGLDDSYVVWFEADGTLQFAMCTSGGNCPRTSAPIPSLNVWHHVAAVWDGSTLRTYVDGGPAGSASFVGPPGHDSNPALIGADDNNVDGVPDEGWNGLIDEVVIYDSALTPEEILVRSTAPIHDCTTGVAPEDGTSARPLITSVRPNPANGIVEITFHIPAAGLGHILIHDCSGRQVIDFTNDFTSAGEHVTYWNGKAASGMPVASGIYFIHVEAVGHASVAKLLILR